MWNIESIIRDIFIHLVKLWKSVNSAIQCSIIHLNRTTWNIQSLLIRIYRNFYTILSMIYRHKYTFSVCERFFSSYFSCYYAIHNRCLLFVNQCKWLKCRKRNKRNRQRMTYRTSLISKLIFFFCEKVAIESETEHLNIRLKLFVLVCCKITEQSISE